MTRLADMKPGCGGRVRQILGDDEISLRLLEMGVTPGVDIRVIGAAPLGDPLELQLRGYRLSVRKSEAARIELE
ncbi:MAG TPA: ferrous iron transport protein A [Pirellulales bacterium]|jgi:ferrous iron transport protein A|nr:ferrous iron transport protein A [Pirellulales bacterium]